MPKEIILLVVAYLLGSVPTGLLLARASGVDIRTTGSGNIGATNVYRTMGRKLGIMTLVGDCLKGLIPVVAARYLDLSTGAVAMVGLAAFLGHVYTIFLGFKGGKGVATALGVFLGVSWVSVLAALVISPWFCGDGATCRSPRSPLPQRFRCSSPWWSRRPSSP